MLISQPFRWSGGKKVCESCSKLLCRPLPVNSHPKIFWSGRKVFAHGNQSITSICPAMSRAGSVSTPYYTSACAIKLLCGVCKSTGYRFMTLCLCRTLRQSWIWQTKREDDRQEECLLSKPQDRRVPGNLHLTHLPERRSPLLLLPRQKR